MSDIYQRKRDHIDLCNAADVHAGDHHGLFADVTLIHSALPELSMADLDLRTPLLDHILAAPLMVTGMTGGPEEAGEINRGIAQVCQEFGLAFGVGSQRIITRADQAAASFQVRDVAPDVVLLGNIGINQARDMGIQVVSELMKRIGADYMAIHLNPAMELVQPGADADRDFRRGYETIGRLIDALDGKIIVKECATGIGPVAVRKLQQAGVRAIDVSGSGGTSWIKVEALRAQGRLSDLGMLFADWGIPTAAATALAHRAAPKTQIIASGGIGDGLTAAKAIALGATLVGSARPVLQAFLAGGVDGARDFLEFMLQGLRMAIALTGCQRPAELVAAPRVIGPRLQRWLDQVAL